MLISVSGANNQAVADRAVFNANPAGEKSVQFNQGDILKGVVQEARPDGMVSLLVRNSLVSVASDVAVAPGQHLYLLVDSFKGNQAFLKLIAAQASAELDDHVLSDTLRSTGVPSNPDTIMVARGLLEHDLPVNLQNITEVINAMNMVGGISARNLEAAIFALEHNLPLDENIFPFIRQFISTDGDLSRLIRELIQLLNQMESVARPGTAGPVVPAPAVAAGSANPVAQAVVITPGAADPVAPAVVITPASADTAVPAAVITSGSANLAAPVVVITSASSEPVAPALVITSGFANSANNAAPNLAETGVETISSTLNTVQDAAGNNVVQTTSDNMANAGQNLLNPLVASASSTIQTGGNPDVNVPANPVLPEAAGDGSGQANNPSIAPNPTVGTGGEAVVEANTGTGAAQNNAALAVLISANLTTTADAAQQPPVKLDHAAPDTASTKGTMPVNFTELSGILRALLDSVVGKITESGDDTAPVLRNLLKGRTLLLDNLRRMVEIFKADETLSKNPEVRELLARIGNLQQQITGQALFNSAARPGQDVFTNSYYFSFPVEIDKQLRYCQLRIQKNTQSRLNQQENIKLAVSLDTSALGIVIFHIDWYKQGHIKLQGITETAKACDFVEKNMNELLGCLNKLGYSTSNLGVKTAGKPEELILKPHLKEAEQNRIGRFSIDVTA